MTSWSYMYFLIYLFVINQNLYNVYCCRRSWLGRNTKGYIIRWLTVGYDAHVVTLMMVGLRYTDQCLMFSTHATGSEDCSIIWLYEVLAGYFFRHFLKKFLGSIFPMEVCKTHALHFGKIMSCLQLKRLKNTRFIFLNDPIDGTALM